MGRSVAVRDRPALIARSGNLLRVRTDCASDQLEDIEVAVIKTDLPQRSERLEAKERDERHL